MIYRRLAFGRKIFTFNLFYWHCLFPAYLNVFLHQHLFSCWRRHLQIYVQQLAAENVNVETIYTWHEGKTEKQFNIHLRGT